MAPTLVDFSQLSKQWKIGVATLLTLMSIGGVVILYQGKNAAGVVTHKVLSDGSLEGSGHLLVGSGSTTTLYADSGKVGIGTRSPETQLEVIGSASGRTLHAQDYLQSSGALAVRGAAVFGSTLKLNGVTYTFPTGDGSSSGKVLKTNGAGQLAWSMDGPFVTVGTRDADYLTDGTADQVEIQSAINAASGGTLYVRKATYDIASTVNVGSNLTIRCERGAKFTLASGVKFSISAKQNVIMEDCTTDGVNQVVNNYAIDIENSSGVLLNRLNVLRSKGFGVFINANSGAPVQNVWVTNSYLQGQGNNDVIGGGSGIGTQAKDIFILNNKVVQDASQGANYDGAIAMTHVRNVHFTGNNTEGLVAFSFEVHPFSYSMIDGNIARRANGSTRLYIGMDGNGSAASGSYALAFKDNIVEGGDIRIGANSTYRATQILVDGNAIRGGSSVRGIYMDNCDLCSVSNNSIQGSSSGVYLYNVHRTRVVNNSMDDVTQGIREDGGSDTNFVSGNVMGKNVTYPYVGLSSTTLLLTVGSGSNVLNIVGVGSGRVLHAQDQLRSSGSFVVEGTSIFEGYVGIGTASPSVALDINNPVGGAQVYIRDPNSGFKIAPSGGTNYFESAGAGMAGGADLRFTNMNAANTWMTIKSTGNVGIGTSSPETELELIGTASGRTLHAQDVLRSSGTLLVEGVTTLQGAVTMTALPSCSSLQTSSVGALSCGSGASGFGSGNVLTIGSQNYVKKAGDTMTGGLLIQSGTLHGTLPGVQSNVLLETAGTLSGYTLKATDSLASSGTLIVKKRAGTSTGNILVIDTKGLVYDATNKRVGIGTASPSASATLHVIGSIYAQANDNLFGDISGGSYWDIGNLADTDVWADARGAATDIGMNFRLKGAGLFYFKDASSNNLMTITSTGLVGVGKTPSQKLEVTGTMSGAALTIMNGTSYFRGGSVGVGTIAPETKLEVVGTASGRTIHAHDVLQSSGALAIDGTAFLNSAAVFGSTLKLNGVTYTFPTGDGSASGRVLKTNGAGQLSWSPDTDTDTNTTYTAGQGLTLSSTTFKLNATLTGTTLRGWATISGSTLRADSDLRSSGTLVIQGATTLKNSPSCTTLQTSSTGLVSCNNSVQPLDATLTSLAAYNTNGLLTQTAADTFTGRSIAGTTNRIDVTNGNGVSGNPTVDISSSYVGQTTLTTLGTLTTSPLANVALNVAGVGSGRTLLANDVLVSSGTLLVRKKAGSSTGNILIVDTKGLVYDATNKRVGIGLSSPNFPLDVVASNNMVSIRSANSSNYTQLTLGRTTAEFELDVAAGAGHFMTGTVAADSVIKYLSTNKLFLGPSGGGAPTMVLDGSRNVGIGTTSPETAFEVIGTASGRILHAQDELRSSGSLAVERDAVVQRSLTQKTALSCDSVDTTATGMLVCGTDAGAGAGITQAEANGWYVNDTGDSMTGGLLIQLLANGTPATIDANTLLEVVGTASGRTLLATDTLSSSGVLVVRKNAGSSTGNILVVDTKGLVYDATNKTVGIGTLNTSSVKLNVAGTMSGRSLQVTGTGSAPLLYTYVPNGRIGLGTTTPSAGKVYLSLSRATAFDASNGTTWHDLVVHNTNGSLASAIGLAFEDSSAYNTNGAAGIAAVKEVASSDFGAGLAFVTRPQSSVAVERVRITSNGYVGIGSTTAKSKLFVSGSGSFTGTMSGSAVIVGAGAAATPSFSFSNDSDTGLYWISANTLGFTTGGSERMRLDSSGRLGIGTNAPGSRLSVSGSVIINPNQAGSVTADTNTGLEIIGTASGRTLMATDTLSSSGTFILRKNAGTSTGNILLVDSKGLIYDGTNKRVGVGTTAPETALEVIGTMSGAGLNVGGGQTMTRIYSNTATIDFASVNGNTCTSASTITVTGAADGDVVSLGFSNAADIDGVFKAWVSAANTVSVKYCNITLTSKDPASGTFRVEVHHF